MLVTARSSQLSPVSAVAFARGTGISCPFIPQVSQVMNLSRQGQTSPLGAWNFDFVVVGVEATPVGCMGGITDAVGDLIVNAQHDVQSTNGGLVASLHQTATHSLTTHLTPMTPLTNHVAHDARTACWPSRSTSSRSP